LALLDLEIKTRNFDLIKKIMKKFKEQCDNSKNSNNQRVYIVQANGLELCVSFELFQGLAAPSFLHKNFFI